jgi:Family of unknown function (DUF6505)
VTRMLRTIRLDPSDTFAFPQAAEPGEWAVPGTFMFWDEDAAALAGKRRVAFRSGFLGLSSLGWSTLCVVVDATAEERADAVRLLAEHLFNRLGAPGMGAALAAAEEEVTFAESCADHPDQTLVVIHRRIDEEGAVREQFRTVKAGVPFNVNQMSRVFTFHEVEGEDEPEERIDLAGLAEAKAR